MTNTAKPSDQAIAQAFREHAPAAEHWDTQCLMAHIEKRAREIDIQQPQQAEGQPGARVPDALEELSESDKDVALAQAVEFAQYVSDHARGEMCKAAERFLSFPYSQEIAGRLGQQPAQGDGTAVVTHAQAREMLDSLDDYARMEVGVNAKGNRETLAKYITQQEGIESGENEDG